ncbi:MAG: response regulator [Anaerolineae bacterium]
MSETLRILVVDDDPSMAKTLVDIFKVKGHQAEAAHSGPEALAKVAQGSFGSAHRHEYSRWQDRHFDCVLTDVKMPGVNGVELYRALKARQPDLPVVLMTAYSTDRLVEEGLGEGAIAVLTKPLDINALLSFFSALRRERSIVIVDDDTEFARTLGDILRARDFAVTQVTDPHSVVEGLRADGQVVLLDMRLNNINGLDVLQEIRERYPHLPVILVTGYRGEMASAIEAALDIGAYTCLYKPFKIDRLVQVLTEIRHQELGRVLLRGE